MIKVRNVFIEDAKDATPKLITRKVDLVPSYWGNVNGNLIINLSEEDMKEVKKSLGPIMTWGVRGCYKVYIKGTTLAIPALCILKN